MGRPPLRLVEPPGPAPSRPAASVPLGRALELMALGAGLTLAVTLLALLPPWLGALGAFQALYSSAFVFYLLVVLRLERFTALPHAGLLVLAVAIAARIALLPLPPSLSDDLYRYVWEGRVAAAGFDPWRTPPTDPALEALRDREIHPAINHPELAAIYPPLAVAGFALVAAVSPTVAAFKAWVVLHDVALVLVLLAWARRLRLTPVAVAAYAWNPLVLVEYAGTGHHEPTALLGLALAFLWRESRPAASAAALAAAVLVKPAPLVVLPFFLARWPWRARIVALALLVPGLGAWLLAARGESSGLAAYWGSWRNNELIFHLLERATGSFAAARTLAIAALAAVVAWALARRLGAERGARRALRAALLLSPVLHPWYLGWVLAVEPLAVSAPWLLLSWTAILNYGVFTTPPEGRGFHLPLAWRLVEYGIPLAAAAALALARRRRRAAGRPGGAR